MTRWLTRLMVKAEVTTCPLRVNQLDTLTGRLFSSIHRSSRISVTPAFSSAFVACVKAAPGTLATSTVNE